MSFIQTVKRLDDTIPVLESEGSDKRLEPRLQSFSYPIPLAGRLSENAHLLRYPKFSCQAAALAKADLSSRSLGEGGPVEP